jgi:hypothetical protein
VAGARHAVVEQTPAHAYLRGKKMTGAARSVEWRDWHVYST